MPRSRRRRDRPDRLQASPARTAGPTLAGRPIASAREWRWRTFPVFFTFAATLFLTVAAAAILPGYLLLIVGALIFAAALSHLVSVLFIAPRMRPGAARRPEDRAP